MRFYLSLCLYVSCHLMNAQNITANYAVSGVFCTGSLICFTDLSLSNNGSIISWDWLFSDGTSNSNLQNPCHIFTFPATYTVMLKVINSNGDMDSTYQSITIGSCTKVIENYFNNTISIYPNPTKEILNIDLIVPNQNTKINIYNSLGELILSKDIVNQNSIINTNQLQSGLYYLNVLKNNKTIKTDKLIITK